MKKGFGKRCLTLGLTLAMTAGLCACGGGGQEADPALAKEHVYRVQEIELPKMFEPGEGDMYVETSAQGEDRVYALVRVSDYMEYKENDYRLISMKKDGSDLKVVSLEFPEQQNGEEGGDSPVAPDEPVTVPEDAPADEPVAAPEVSVSPEEPEEEVGGETTLWESVYYRSFSVAASGTVYGVKMHSFNDMKDPENPLYWTEIGLCSWDAEGKLSWESNIGKLEENANINYMLPGADNSLYLLLEEYNEDYSDRTFYRIRIDGDGSVGDKTKLADNTAEAFKTLERIVPQKEGSALVIFSEEDDWQKRYYAYYDIEADSLGEAKDLPSGLDSYGMMMAGTFHDLLYGGSNGIYCWNQGQAEGQAMVDFVNSDLYIQNISGIIELSETSFLGIYTEDWQSGVKAGIFTYVDPADIQDKKVLVMGGNWIESDLKKRVIEYNRNNPEYRIVLREYNIYNDYTTEDGYKGGITKLNSDITTGNMPDILVVNDGDLPVANYISKGLVADIDKLIQEDEELSQVEFMQSAFDAYRVNGKLYYVIPDFEIYTMIAKKSLVGDRETWSMKDMQQVLEQQGGEMGAFSPDVTRDQFISKLMMYCGNQFVDVSTGKCAFNTEDFISMMEFAKTLPKSEDLDDEFYQDFWEHYDSQYRDNRTLLMDANFWMVSNLAYTINGRMGEEVAYVGFPTEDGNGSYVRSSKNYVLSAKSKNLDEAWNFVRYYLTEEYQEKANYFPVRKDMFYEKMQEATKVPTYEWEDENGEVHVEQEDMQIWINGEGVPYEPLSQAQLDELIAFIESVHNPYYYNEEVMKIVTEEIEGFFAGQKPAKDVADVIQRRVQNYVDENS